MLIGHRAGLLDVPTAIKPHLRPVPYTGGAALAATFALAGLAIDAPRSIVVAGLAMWLIGFVDDARGLQPRAKLLLEIVPLVLGTAELDMPPAVRVVAIASGMILVNGFNVIDGLDGLAGGVALITLLGLVAGGAGEIALASVVAGAVGGFLIFNLNPARLFLGDQGSLFLGYLLWILPLVSFAANLEFNRLIALGLVWTFPLINLLFVVSRRLRERRSILRGDRDHLYDVLHAILGLRATLLVCWSIAAMSALAAALIYRA